MEGEEIASQVAIMSEPRSLGVEMKYARHLMIVLGCMLVCHLCSAVDESRFAVVKEEQSDGPQKIYVKLDDKKVLVGTRGSADEPEFRSCGVLPESVRAHELGGAPSLIHIEWTDYVQGNGGYQNLFYMICRKDDPSQPLLKGSVPISGRWGKGSGQKGYCRVWYENDILSVRENREFRDNSKTQRPLYHRRGDGSFSCCISTILTRRFFVTDTGFGLKSTLLEYKVQEGDALNDICEGLKIKPEWILNAPLLQKNISTIQIELPADESEKRYPIVADRTAEDVPCVNLEFAK